MKQQAYLVEYEYRGMAHQGRAIVVAISAAAAIKRFLADWDAASEQAKRDCDLFMISDEIKELSVKPWCLATELTI